ncbi:MAG TPA: Flp family type IVb pilin [Gemmatimonadota bacterium]|jgi:Flp pilus assembly pilin Flp|nr:Flp family type IVb pilin [Gemmatimonadota bacterium]
MTARTPLTPRRDEAESPVLGSEWLRAEDGQDLAEYAILVGLIALVVVGAVTLFGGQLVAMYDSFVSTLPFG